MRRLYAEIIAHPNSRQLQIAIPISQGAATKQTAGALKRLPS
jgi:hypothetical protein